MIEEMLDRIHQCPNIIEERYKGTINDEKIIEFYIVPAGNLRAPTLIIHAKDDALVSYKHAENAHSKINQSRLLLRLVLYDTYYTGGHGMLSQMNRTRVLVKEFLNKSAY